VLLLALGRLLATQRLLSAGVLLPTGLLLSAGVLLPTGLWLPTVLRLSAVVLSEFLLLGLLCTSLRHESLRPIRLWRVLPSWPSNTGRLEGAEIRGVRQEWIAANDDEGRIRACISRDRTNCWHFPLADATAKPRSVAPRFWSG
jgi:hypothetical protein